MLCCKSATKSRKSSASCFLAMWHLKGAHEKSAPKTWRARGQVWEAPPKPKAFRVNNRWPIDRQKVHEKIWKSLNSSTQISGFDFGTKTWPTKTWRHLPCTFLVAPQHGPQRSGILHGVPCRWSKLTRPERERKNGQNSAITVWHIFLEIWTQTFWHMSMSE